MASKVKGNVRGRHGMSLPMWARFVFSKISLIFSFA